MDNPTYIDEPGRLASDASSDRSLGRSSSLLEGDVEIEHGYVHAAEFDPHLAELVREEMSWSKLDFLWHDLVLNVEVLNWTGAVPETELPPNVLVQAAEFPNCDFSKHIELTEAQANKLRELVTPRWSEWCGRKLQDALGRGITAKNLEEAKALLASEIADHWDSANREVPAFGSQEFRDWIKRDFPGFLDWFSVVTNWTVERLREGGYHVENFEDLNVALVKLSIMPADDALEAAN